MATQTDIHELLRLLTTGRNKLSMMEAMGRVKVLQSANLRSISSIASTNLETLKAAITDEKAAKSLLKACKLYVKPESNITGKRAADGFELCTKRVRSQYELPVQPQTPDELEESLKLPQSYGDEEIISRSVIYTNRAPLLLAFAVQLMKYTMPEQPLSSRLSLAQAVVSLNANVKSSSSGLMKVKSSQQFSSGPKIKIMNREVNVLKRSGYYWKGDIGNSEASKKHDVTINEDLKNRWNISNSITSKKSTFVARCKQISSVSDVELALQKLFSEDPSLRGASHNIIAWRARDGGCVSEGFKDDGETNGGQHLLNILRTEKCEGILLLVSRWYGGTMLGADRWRIMSEVSRDCLSQRLQVIGNIDRNALWALNFEDDTLSTTIDNALPVFKPDIARAYLLNSISSPPPSGSKDSKAKKSLRESHLEMQENLAFLLDALDLLLSSWATYLSSEELDRRAWAWYIQVRPMTGCGPAAWGGKGEVKLSDILNFRRKNSE